MVAGSGAFVAGRFPFLAQPGQAAQNRFWPLWRLLHAGHGARSASGISRRNRSMGTRGEASDWELPPVRRQAEPPSRSFAQCPAFPGPCICGQAMRFGLCWRCSCCAGRRCWWRISPASPATIWIFRSIRSFLATIRPIIRFCTRCFWRYFTGWAPLWEVLRWGYGLHTLMQALLLACSIAYAMAWLSSIGCPRGLWVAFLVFFARTLRSMPSWPPAEPRTFSLPPVC